MLNRRFRLTMAAALALAVYATATTASRAQQWPTHAVRFVLPFGPGSGADTAARLISEKLQQKWGQSIIIDGRPGGDGLLSLQTVLSAKDDHTLFFGPSSIFVVQRYLHENLPFDPQTDLAPIAGVAKVQIAVAVPTSLGISTLGEFVALARAKPNETSYSVAPGFSEFVFDGFVKENGLAIAKVPYRDITKSPIDLAENRIQLSMQSYAAMRTTAQTGKIKFIAINDRERTPIAPDIPSVVRSRISVAARQSGAGPARAARHGGRPAPADRSRRRRRARRQDHSRSVGAHRPAGRAAGARRVHRRAQRAIRASRPHRVGAGHRAKAMTSRVGQRLFCSAGR
jgi:tripartite-type tricarboxylate transporter receptor subunit TctC